MSGQAHIATAAFPAGQVASNKFVEPCIVLKNYSSVQCFKLPFDMEVFEIQNFIKMLLF